jgi:hypothetical protein
VLLLHFSTPAAIIPLAASFISLSLSLSIYIYAIFLERVKLLQPVRQQHQQEEESEEHQEDEEKQEQKTNNSIF